MRRPTQPPPTHRLVERLDQTRRLGDIGQQPSPHMRDDAPPVGGDDDPRKTRGSLHLRSAFPIDRAWTLNKPRIA